MSKLFYVIFAVIAAIIVFSVVLFFLSKNKEKGALQITSIPNSKVYLNSKPIGNTPFRTNDLKDMILEGEYTIKLVPLSGNFVPFEQKVTISPKVLTVVDTNFAQKGLDNASIISLSSIEDKKDAQISVVTFPQDSEVFLDSNPQGLSPLLLKNITESDHELKVTKEGYKDKILRIRTVLGYKLDTIIYLGINPNIASPSAISVSSPSAFLQQNSLMVTILKTPTGFLRVRQEPSVSALEITQVKPGEKYPLVEEKTGWFEIMLTNQTLGWISSQYAAKN
jgi:hypothetical protein